MEKVCRVQEENGKIEEVVNMGVEENVVPEAQEIPQQIPVQEVPVPIPADDTNQVQEENGKIDEVVNMGVEENVVPEAQEIPQQIPVQEVPVPIPADDTNQVQEENGKIEEVVNMGVEENVVPEAQEIPQQIPVQEVPVPIPADDTNQDSNSHDHQEAEEGDCPLCKEAEEKELKEAEQKRLEDTKKFEEEVQRNVHDARSRAIADQLKHKPFEAGNVEEVMHGGHHVHGENGDEKAKPSGVDLSDILGMPDSEPKKEAHEPGTLDPDELVHFGAEDHDHGDPHKEKPAQVINDPVADSPDDLLPRHERRELFGPMMEGMSADGASEIHGKTGSQTLDDADNPNAGEEDIGVNVERIVHGEDHVHDHQAGGDDEDADDSNKARKITYDDIMSLGLSQEDLKGIDIKKLLTDNEEEYQAWQEENNKDTGQMSFWEQLSELRRLYFGSDAKKVKDVSKVNADDVEWEQTGDEEDDGVHEGESELEHEMEMWGSTVGRKNRKPYKQLRGEDL